MASARAKPQVAETAASPAKPLKGKRYTQLAFLHKRRPFACSHGAERRRAGDAKPAPPRSAHADAPSGVPHIFVNAPKRMGGGMKYNAPTLTRSFSLPTRPQAGRAAAPARRAARAAPGTKA